MANPLYGQMNNSNIIQQFMQFKQNFRGNPQAQIQEMLNSGRISQAQYNMAVQKAQQLQQLLNFR